MSPKPNGNSLDSKIEYAGALPNQDAVSAPAGPPLPLPQRSVTQHLLDSFSAFSGMFAFAGTMLLMALYNLGAGGVHVSNVLVGMLVFAGGIAQFMVAMWEIARGNTLFATCFFYAAVLIPSFGVMEAYKDAPEELPKALGLYLFVWFITIFLHLPAVIGKSHLFTVLLSFASLAVLMLSCGMYTQIKTLAYYIGLAGLLASDPGSAFTLPLF
ncbi:hypothetical protein D9611_014569 [Ephemerocybe angulata]|uniref:GPR1/FUN34/yaaH family-domain-containing protein n=1 Tax=Ephemerocybe angulata TaxID=980116 RepID=A0A8H5FF38_9AGAR|nr:hypothetical protein D9611_014569 [Tulosesus angulatus]